MAESKLSEAAKLFVVQSLACFDSPSVVVAAVRTEFGVEITAPSIQAYDPTKYAGRNLSERWRQVFETTRKTFLEDTAAIGVSHRAVRLRMLQRLVDRAVKMNAVALAADLLEQAAKEAGDAYSNRQKVEVTGKDGGPLEMISHAADSAKRRLAEKLAAGGGASVDREPKP